MNGGLHWRRKFERGVHGLPGNRTMASPVGHALVGLALAGPLAPALPIRSRLKWCALVVVAANAADLDFAAGLAVGDINRYHHGVTHSLGAAAIFGALVALFAGRWWPDRLRVALGSALAYGSHILVDAFSGGQREFFARGCLQPAFWPLSDQPLPVIWPLFHGIHHGVRGDSLATFFQRLLSMNNGVALAIEFALTLPLVVVSFHLAQWLRQLEMARQEGVAMAAAESAPHVETELAG